MNTKLKQSGRVRWTEGIGWLPAQVGQRRRGLQSVFQVEGETILSSTLVFCTEPQGHPIDWLESLCLNHYDVDKTQKILVSSSVHGIAYLYDQCCFQGTHTHTHTHDVSRVQGSLSTPGSSAECVLWCITHRFVLINMILVSWFSSSLSRSVGSHHHYLVIGSHYHYLGHHLNDFKSYFSYFGHTPHLRVFGPCL